MCSVFWLFWLSCQFLPNDWLERLLWGSLCALSNGDISSDLWPRFQGHGIFEVEYLKNGAF